MGAGTSMGFAMGSAFAVLTHTTGSVGPSQVPARGRRRKKLAQDAKGRLFPGLTAKGHEQASLAAAVGGLGWSRARDIARPANLGVLISAAPKVRAMAAAAVHAGLFGASKIEELLESRTRLTEEAYLAGLDEVKRVKAEDFLR